MSRMNTQQPRYDAGKNGGAIGSLPSPDRFRPYKTGALLAGLSILAAWQLLPSRGPGSSTSRPAPLVSAVAAPVASPAWEDPRPEEVIESAAGPTGAASGLSSIPTTHLKLN